MSKNAMRTTLFWLLIFVLLVTVSLTSYATITAIHQPESDDSLWKFVYFTWSGVLLEVVGFIISLANNLFGLRSDDLAQAIANKWAQEIVNDSKGDSNALSTTYWQTRDDLQVYFRTQGNAWLRVLLSRFKDEIIKEARRVQALKSWKLPTKKPDLWPIDLPAE